MEISFKQELCPGSHVCYRMIVNWHHGIYIGNDTFIQYNGKNDEDPSISQVSASKFLGGDFNKRLYVRTYKHELLSLFSPEDVIKRAASRLGESRYNLILSNCEHFATWCKVDEWYSGQVQWLSSKYPVLNYTAESPFADMPPKLREQIANLRIAQEVSSFYIDKAADVLYRVTAPIGVGAIYLGHLVNVATAVSNNRPIPPAPPYLPHVMNFARRNPSLFESEKLQEAINRRINSFQLEQLRKEITQLDTVIKSMEIHKAFKDTFVGIAHELLR